MVWHFMVVTSYKNSIVAKFIAQLYKSVISCLYAWEELHQCITLTMPILWDYIHVYINITLFHAFSHELTTLFKSLYTPNILIWDYINVTLFRDSLYEETTHFIDIYCIYRYMLYIFYFTNKMFAFCHQMPN